MKKELGRNYPGMFDLLKGVILFSIVLTHTRGLIPDALLFGGEPSFLKSFFYVVVEVLQLRNTAIPALFFISGYSFKPTAMGKCLKKQSRQLLKPYYITGAAVAAVHLICHFCAFRYFPGALRQTGIVALSHLMGLQQGFLMGDIQLCFIGSVWFLLALFEGWLLLNLVMEYLPRKSHGILAILFIFLSYYLIAFAPPAITFTLCFTYIFLCAGCMYVGLWIKENNWLWKPLHPAVWTGIAVLAISGNTILYFPQTAQLPMVIPFFVVTIGALCGAFFLLWAFVRLNRFHNWFFDKVRVVGRYSFWVLCTHTVEAQGLLWYVVVDRFASWGLLTMTAVLILRGMLIFLMCLGIYQWKKHRRQSRKPALSR